MKAILPIFIIIFLILCMLPEENPLDVLSDPKVALSYATDRITHVTQDTLSSTMTVVKSKLPISHEDDNEETDDYAQTLP